MHKLHKIVQAERCVMECIELNALASLFGSNSNTHFIFSCRVLIIVQWLSRLINATQVETHLNHYDHWLQTRHRWDFETEIQMHISAYQQIRFYAKCIMTDKSPIWPIISTPDNVIKHGKRLMNRLVILEDPNVTQ